MMEILLVEVWIQLLKFGKFKKLIINDVFDYFSFDIPNEKKKEFLFEFIFSSVINSYAYWYRHQDITDLCTFVTFLNKILLNAIDCFID